MFFAYRTPARGRHRERLVIVALMASALVLALLTGHEAAAQDPDRPTSRDDCKDGGWQKFTDPSFSNQGECIAFVASGPAAGRIGDWILDPEARGHISFTNTANVASFQQEGIFTYEGWQYVAWYRGDRRTVIARRQLPDGAWESTELDYLLAGDDSHNTIAMTVTPSDGRIHLAMEARPTGGIRYVRSVPGVTDDPSAVEWSSQLFRSVSNSLPGTVPTSFSYPRFEQVGDETLLSFRIGSATNGRSAVTRYNDDADGTWTFEGLFTHNLGTFDGGFGESGTRNSYLHGFSANPDTGELAVAISWRENPSGWCEGAIGTHSLAYAVSPDAGRTWNNNDGELVATTTLGPTDDNITPFTPGIVVVDIPINVGLINQEAQGFDSQGRFHVMTSRVPDEDLPGDCVSDFRGDREELGRPYHHWRDTDGTWHTLELPVRSYAEPTATNDFGSGRTKILFDEHDSAYVVLPDARIIAASAATEWTDWRIVFDAADVDNVSELIFDRSRIAHDGMLSVVYQEPSEGNAPSAFRVADFALGSQRPDRPRNTEPEEPPAPFVGTADDAESDNLALNVTGAGFPGAFADSHQPDFPPRLVNDGNADTFWVSAGTEPGDGPSPEDPVAVGIDFGEPTTFSQVTMVPRAGPARGPRDYTVEVSDDGEDWEQVGEVVDAPNSTVVTDFEPVTATRVRLVVTGSYPGAIFDDAPNTQVAELEVRDVPPNLARNPDGAGFPRAFADSHQPDFPPSNLNDGDHDTFWVSDGTVPGEGPSPENPITAGIDFGEPTSFTEVTMVPRMFDGQARGPASYRIEVSDDGEDWRVVAEVPDVPEQPVEAIETEFDRVTASQVRLVVTDGYDPGAEEPRNTQIAEIEVRGF